MAEALKIEDKPYMVMEGICTSQIDNSKIKKDSKLKTIMYSGSLRYRFGIKNLLDAFSLIKDDNYRLILCGSGDMDDEINQLAKEDKRIIFKGYTRREDVLKRQRESTLLINPRQNNEEFTKYSFPSKTMEYMASGTPVLMYKLDGIPDEYNKYLDYVSDDTIEGLKNSIIKICERSEEKNIEQGKRAQKFVIEEKNNIKQTKRIIQFIKANK
jgi:glycosyltransferase involved in cell wall biosynthesis